MIKGIGVDVVEISRFADSLVRTPGMRERLFTESELAIADETHPTFLAGRFAAKWRTVNDSYRNRKAARRHGENSSLHFT